MTVLSTEGITPPEVPTSLTIPTSNTPAVNHPATPQPTIPSATDPDKVFSAADIENARRQEKDKVYGKIESLQTQIATLAEEREARLKAEQAQAEAEAEAARIQREAEETLAEKLSRTQQELEQRLDAEKRARELLEVTLVKEREFNQLVNYRTMAVAAAQDNILPELLDYVVGNTPEEIDQSIAGLVQRTESILEHTSSALQTQRQNAPGPRVTVPPNGPLEIQSAQQGFNPEDVANMSMTEFASIRQQLGLTGSGNNRGLFDR